MSFAVRILCMGSGHGSHYTPAIRGLASRHLRLTLNVCVTIHHPASKTAPATKPVSMHSKIHFFTSSGDESDLCDNEWHLDLPKITLSILGISAPTV